MKRALIAIASVAVLVPAAWVVEANAQQMSPASPPSQAYAPSQMAPTQSYAQQRRARRYARRSPSRRSPSNGGVV
jgi:nitrate reductase cytochrome c-type subunit